MYDRLVRNAALILASATCLSCHSPAAASPPTPPRSESPTSAGTAAVGIPSSASAAATSSAAPPDPELVVADPATLARLSEFNAGATLLGVRATSMADLASHPAFRTLSRAVEDDLAADRRADPSAGVGMRHAHRQFDVRWLASEKTRLDLVAIVNRLDRRPFAPAHCGEVRFVYRLAYRVETASGVVDSRLPMTVNVVYYDEPSRDGDCTDAARAWLRPATVEGSDAEAAWLVSADGPLSASRRAAWTPKSVELNYQSVRWPSTVRPTMGGHAEYVMRAFHRSERPPYFLPSPLENTVDVKRVAQSPALRVALLAWIRTPDALGGIDAGVVRVPDQFLAERAVSVSPHGLARRGNRPYQSLFDPSEFASPDLRRYETIKTPAALLRRLDALSCPGCHQSRSLAGFHLLGVESPTDTVDAIEVPMSPHFHAELERRRPYVLAVAEGRAPDERRPSPERGAHDDGDGARCGLGDAGFAAWTCATGLRCERTDDADVGVCAPEAGPGVGDACETGLITGDADSHRDTTRSVARTTCADGRVCEASAVGFPGGMCSGGCASLPEGAVCGGIPVLTEFNACLATGTPFDRCVAENTRPGALRSCGFHAPCRDDYVCARVGEGRGACMPPYFLFQLRVDGHPILADRSAAGEIGSAIH